MWNNDVNVAKTINFSPGGTPSLFPLTSCSGLVKFAHEIIWKFKVKVPQNLQYFYVASLPKIHDGLEIYILIYSMSLLADGNVITLKIQRHDTNIFPSNFIFPSNSIRFQLVLVELFWAALNLEWFNGADGRFSTVHVEDMTWSSANEICPPNSQATAWLKPW